MFYPGQEYPGLAFVLYRLLPAGGAVLCNSSVHSLCPVVHRMENNTLCIPECHQPRPSCRLLESCPIVIQSRTSI